MEFDFLSPVEPRAYAVIEDADPQQLAQRLRVHTEESFPDLEGVRLAIVGVCENRGDFGALSPADVSEVRKAFYALYPGNWNGVIADLGNILPGSTLSDTYYALKSAVAGLIRRGIIPIVIGGSQDLTYAMYRAYDKLEQVVNIVSIDAKFDIGSGNTEVSPARSYLSRIIVEEPNNLFNFANLGFQTYFNAQEEVDLIEKLYFDAYRLGEVSHQLALAEPVLRDADLVSLDMTSVMSSVSGNVAAMMPNGFSGKEICALARYAGISDKVSAFGVFNHEGSAAEAALIAQVIWYFVEGVHYRSNEYPFGDKSNYLKYIVPLDSEELVFYKSDKSDRWWIEVTHSLPGNNKSQRNSLLPCSYEEYLAACNQELPERWWKAQRKALL